MNKRIDFILLYLYICTTTPNCFSICNLIKKIDLKKIEEHIYELLFTQDCVIIPHFGGFVGQYNSSVFNSELNTITPPSKTASFNKHLKNDDGLLTHDIANHQKISYNEASETIKQYVLELKSKLQSDKRLEIQKVGTLYLDEKNSLKFIASNTNFSTQHFGLPIVKANTRINKIVVEEPEITSSKTKVIIEDTTPVIPLVIKKKNVNYWWAAAVIIPIIFYSAWIPLKTDLISDSKQFHYSDLNPFTFQKLKTYTEQSIATVTFENFNFSSTFTNKIEKRNLDDSTYLWVNSEIEPTIAEAETTFVELKEVEIVEKIKLNKSYHLIGGCFEDESNATNLVLQLKELGYNSKIIDQNKGLYRVSVADFSDRNAAKDAKEKLQSEQDLTSWILKK